MGGHPCPSRGNHRRMGGRTQDCGAGSHSMNRPRIPVHITTDFRLGEMDLPVGVRTWMNAEEAAEMLRLGGGDLVNQQDLAAIVAVAFRRIAALERAARKDTK